MTSSSPSIRDTILSTLAITPSLQGDLPQLKAACGVECSNTAFKRALGSLAFKQDHRAHGVKWRHVYDPVLEQRSYLVTTR